MLNKEDEAEKRIAQIISSLIYILLGKWAWSFELARGNSSLIESNEKLFFHRASSSSTKPHELNGMIAGFRVGSAWIEVERAIVTLVFPTQHRGTARLERFSMFESFHGRSIVSGKSRSVFRQPMFANTCKGLGNRLRALDIRKNKFQMILWFLHWFNFGIEWKRIAESALVCVTSMYK